MKSPKTELLVDLLSAVGLAALVAFVLLMLAASQGCATTQEVPEAGERAMLLCRPTDYGVPCVEVFPEDFEDRPGRADL